MFLPSAAAGVVATASVTPSESNVTPGSDTSWSSPGGQNELGLPRFGGQGWWLGQATWVRTSWSVISNSSGVR
jgi:hypothetical protein